ncbi:MAG: hypothetical protein QOD70_3084 [Frankiales bacterium]|jgi:hypothetical protein|nr:hypothetical protein [Frankiales bacterium]
MPSAGQVILRHLSGDDWPRRRTLAGLAPELAGRAVGLADYFWARFRRHAALRSPKCSKPGVSLER